MTCTHDNGVTQVTGCLMNHTCIWRVGHVPLGSGVVCGISWSHVRVACRELRTFNGIERVCRCMNAFSSR